MIMESFVNYLITLSIIISAFIAFTHLVYSLSKDRYTAKWRYYVWLILAIRLLIPLDISLKSLSFNVPTFQENIRNNEVYKNERLESQSPAHSFDTHKNVQSNNIKNTSSQNSGNTTHKEELAEPQNTKVVEHLSIHQIVFIIWISGVFAFIGIDMLKYRLFKRKLARWRMSASKKQYNEVLLGSLNKMNINNKINLYVSRAINTPMLAGIIKPSIYIPHENYSMEEFEIIIKHELVHFKRHDLLYKLILMLAKDVHWFNPFVHFMVNEANKDLEFICDEEVVKNEDTEYRRRYAKILLDSARTAKSKVQLATGMFGGVKTIKRRFVNILNAKQNKKGYKFIFGIALLLIVSNLFISCDKNVSAPHETSKIDNTVSGDLWELPREDEDLVQRIALKGYGADMPVLEYASDKIAIVSAYWGIAVYDLEKERLWRVVDLVSIDMSHTQGDFCRVILVNKEGTQIIIGRMFKDPENPVPSYLYDIEKDKLEVTTMEYFDNYPNNMYSLDSEEVKNFFKDMDLGLFNYRFAKIGPDKWVGLKYDIGEWHDMRSLNLYVFENGKVSKKQIFDKYNDLPSWPTATEIIDKYLNYMEGGKRYEESIGFKGLTEEEVMRKFKEGTDWTYIETDGGIEKYMKKIGNYDVLIGVFTYRNNEANEVCLYVKVYNYE